jgi:CBS domain-containing protein
MKSRGEVMNIAFFLTPKSELVTLKRTMTLKQALEKMELHKYSAVPVVDKFGTYIYTLSEGDILWYLKNRQFSLEVIEKTDLDMIERSREVEAISINASINDVIELTQNQNFVPVIDDSGIFIGIVKRGDLMNSSIYAKPKTKQSHVDQSNYVKEIVGLI